MPRNQPEQTWNPDATRDHDPVLSIYELLLGLGGVSGHEHSRTAMSNRKSRRGTKVRSIPTASSRSVEGAIHAQSTSQE